MSLSPIILPVNPTAGQAHLNYHSPTGTFFRYDVATGTIPDKGIKNCRDEIRWQWEMVNPMDGYVGRKDAAFYDPVVPYIGLTKGIAWPIDKFAALWFDLETTLGLADRTIVHPTDKVGAVILHLSPFWMANDTRRSLVTLFMRAFARHPSDGVNAALKAYPLACLIESAIAHFLEGNTCPTYDRLSRCDDDDRYVGVVTEFRNLSPAEIAGKLVKLAVA